MHYVGVFIVKVVEMPVLYMMSTCDRKRSVKIKT